MNHRFADLTGGRFGTLLVVGLNPERRKGTTRWDCRCDCGRLVTIGIGDLKVAKSCGCQRQGKRAVGVGDRFGRLVALEYVPGGPSAWRCRCDCGNERTVLTLNLRKGRTRSCGCYQTERRIRHGMTGTKFIARLYAAQRRARRVAAGGSHTVDEVRALWGRQEGLCACCGVDLRTASYELDHIVPLSRGGSNSITNLQWLCQPCNRTKHARPMSYLLERRGMTATGVPPTCNTIASADVLQVCEFAEDFASTRDVTGPCLGAPTAGTGGVGSSRVDLQACKLEYSIVSPK